LCSDAKTKRKIKRETKLKKLSLQFKLMAVCFGLATISLIVGLVGESGFSNASEGIEMLGNSDAKLAVLCGKVSPLPFKSYAK